LATKLSKSKYWFLS